MDGLQLVVQAGAALWLTWAAGAFALGALVEWRHGGPPYPCAIPTAPAPTRTRGRV